MLRSALLFNIDVQNYAGLYPEFREIIAQNVFRVAPHRLRRIISQPVVYLCAKLEGVKHVLDSKKMYNLPGAVSALRMQRMAQKAETKSLGKHRAERSNEIQK